MRFWDTSTLLPLFSEEGQSPLLRKIYSQDRQVMIWWGTPIEAISALARAEREGILDAKQLSLLINRLRSFFKLSTVVQPTSVVAERAQRLLLAHPLRAADAMQLAAALIGHSERPRDSTFLSTDKRLREAARREGFTLLPE